MKLSNSLPQFLEESLLSLVNAITELAAETSREKAKKLTLLEVEQILHLNPAVGKLL